MGFVTLKTVLPRARFIIRTFRPSGVTTVDVGSTIDTWVHRLGQIHLTGVSRMHLLLSERLENGQIFTSVVYPCCQCLGLALSAMCGNRKNRSGLQRKQAHRTRE